MDSLWIAVMFAAQIVGGLLIVALLLTPENRVGNRLLAGLIGLGLLNQWFNGLQLWGLVFTYPFLLRLKFPINLCAGPLLYFYILSMTSAKPFTGRQLGRHLIVPGFGVLWYLAFLLWGGSEYFTAGPALEWERYARGIILTAVGAAYIGLSYRQVGRFAKGLPQLVARRDEVGMAWLQLLLGLILLIWARNAVSILLGTDGSTSILGPALQTLAFSVIAVFSLRYSKVFCEVRRNGISNGVRRFTDEELLMQTRRLQDYFREHHPYRNPDLRLGDLADALRLKPYQVSEIFSLGLRTNFFDYVNQRRVLDAQNRLKDPAFRHLSIVGIALDSGFNSKSAFAEAFRKWAKVTPSEFRARYAAELR